MQPEKFGRGMTPHLLMADIAPDWLISDIPLGGYAKYDSVNLDHMALFQGIKSDIHISQFKRWNIVSIYGDGSVKRSPSHQAAQAFARTHSAFKKYGDSSKPYSLDLILKSDVENWNKEKPSGKS